MHPGPAAPLPVPPAIGAPSALVRRELMLDAAVHVAGIVLALVSLPILVTLAAVWNGSFEMMLAVSVYAASMLAMLLFSGAYNLSRGPRARAVLRRLDHAAIYLKIAGTQTPFAVIAGGPTVGWLLTGVWSAALAAATLKLVFTDGWEKLSVGLYLALGWAAIAMMPAFWSTLAPPVLVLVITGGVLYSIGVIFHLWQSLPYQNAIWHLFVLAATFVFYSALLVQLVVDHTAV